MPTAYNRVTETIVLQEFEKKIDQEQGVFSFEKSESPDAIIYTRDKTSIGVEVTSVMRNKKMAIALNLYGLQDSNLPPTEEKILSESWRGNDYERVVISKSKDIVQKKERKKGYATFKTRFDKSVLIIYLDDPLLSVNTFDRIISEISGSLRLNVFNEVYFYIRPTYEIPYQLGINIEWDNIELTRPCLKGFYLIGSQQKNSAKTLCCLTSEAVQAR